MNVYGALVTFPIRLFFVLTPVASITVMLGLTRNMTNDEKVKISIRACIYTTVILFVSALVGMALFDVFGVSLNSLRVSGGIYLLLLGLGMVRSGSLDEVKDNMQLNKTSNDIAITPLAIPLLSGPGTLSFIFVTRPALSHLAEFGLYCLGILEAIVVICLCFVFAAKSSEKMSIGFVKLCEKLMGIMVMSLGIDIAVHGAADYFIS